MLLEPLPVGTIWVWEQSNEVVQIFSWVSRWPRFFFPVLIWIMGYSFDGDLVMILRLLLTNTHS